MKLSLLLENEAPNKEELYYFLSNNCAKFIKESRDKELFRGINNSYYEETIIKNIRKDRRALTGLDDYFNYFDKKLKESGFKAYRSNSIICTGNKKTASYYGLVYRIFPIGNYSYTWNPMIRDYICDYSNHFSHTDTDMNILSYDCREYGVKEAEMLWNKFGEHYKDTDLIQAIDSRREIMLTAEKYIGINFHIDIKNIIRDILK